MPESKGHDLTVLIQTPTPPGLGPGPRAHVESIRSLEDRLDGLIRAWPRSARNVALLRALVFLWHDHLHAAHAIVQDLEDADAALIHAMLHRREPDYWNAKYWFRRVGLHPVYPALVAEVARLLQGDEAMEVRARLLPAGVWNPAAFVDFCQEYAGLAGSEAHRQQAISIQREEFRLLLEHLSA